MLTANRIFSFGLMTAFLIICLAGCGASVTGTKPQTRYYLERSLTAPVYWEVKVAGTPRHVFDAAIKAVEDLSLTVAQQKSDQVTGIINGYFADGTKFNIKMNYDSPNRTHLQLTAGRTGDKTLVLQLFKAIEKYI